MKNLTKTKKIILSSIVGILLGTLISVSYAFFTYNRTGTNNQLITGDIWMRYGESNQLELSNAMPSTTYDSSKYFGFQITGKNTYSKPIHYDISISHGDNHETRTRRIEDKFLKFTLIKEETGKEPEIVVDGKSYNDFSNGTRIAVGTIPANQTNEITYTYKLYMWIDNSVVIGNVDQDYTPTQWDQVYASVKVNVTGDFEEKEVAKPMEDIIKTEQLDTGIKFFNVSSSTNGQGLYKMESTVNDTYPIYYYRGNVNNNNVLFANFCWKIVRTTETGGTKLIYNGSPTIDSNGKKQCNNTTGASTMLSGDTAFNSSYESPAYVGYSYGTVYSYSSTAPTSGVYFGTGIDPTTKKLKGAIKDGLDPTHHYTYNSDNIDATQLNGEDKVRYYWYQRGSTYRFITFDNTKDINTVIDEMNGKGMTFTNGELHASTIQTKINTWYNTYIKPTTTNGNIDYTSYIEDTEFCSDRTVSTENMGGWNPNGTSLSDYMNYDVYKRYSTPTGTNGIQITNKPVLTCSREEDKLSVANGKLTNPVALLTYDEVALAGGKYSTINSSYYLYNGSLYYWLLSPAFMNDSDAYGGNVYTGRMYSYYVRNSYGARPALSLKHGTEAIGKGTSTEPYLVGPQN